MRDLAFRRVMFGLFRRLSERRIVGSVAVCQTANINSWRALQGADRKVGSLKNEVNLDRQGVDGVSGGGGDIPGVTAPKMPAEGRPNSPKGKFAKKESRTSRKIRCERCNCYCTIGKHSLADGKPCRACCIHGTITVVKQVLHPSGRMVDAVVEVPNDRGHRANVGRRARAAWLGVLATKPELARRFCLDHDWRLFVPVIRVDNPVRSRGRGGPSAPQVRVEVIPAEPDNPEFPCTAGCGRVTYRQGPCSACRYAVSHPRPPVDDRQYRENVRISQNWRGRGQSSQRGRGRGEERGGRGGRTRARGRGRPA